MMETFHLVQDVIAPDIVRGPGRRSISIFSRRGVDLSEPTTFPLFSGKMSSSKSQSRQTTTWMKRLGRLNKNSDKGTILHAVPPTLVIPAMSPLDIAIATSPNDEILSSIRKDYSVSPGTSLPPSQDWSDDSASVSPRSSPRQSKIGTWRDGVAHWDAQPELKGLGINMRPDLTVTIPNSTLVKPPMQSMWTLPSLRPSSPAFSRSDLSPSGSKTSSIHPAFRTSNDSEPAGKRSSSFSESATVSGTSTASYEDISDDASLYDGTSSMTSVEEEPELVPASDSVKPNDRSGSVAFSIISPVSAGVFDEQQLPWHEDDYAGSSVPSSPTLSEAVLDLQSHLATIPEDASTTLGEPSPHVSSPTEDTPGIPRKSRKREWRSSASAASKPVPKSQLPADVLIRRSSMPAVIAPTAKPGTIQRSSTTTSVEVALQKVPEDELSLNSTQLSLLRSAINTLPSTKPPTKLAEFHAPSTASEAQTVLLSIMSCLDSVEDIQATSMMNKGMHQVFKANELSLLQKVLRNKSPALWELREWSPLSFSDIDCCLSPTTIEHSPSSYMHDYRKEQVVIRSLKNLILERCQPFLRPITVAALALDNNVNAQRFDDAFYRIWCFCKIFGCEKEREDDVTGQLDWLRGGILAHQKECAATINMNLEFDMSGVLLNAPDYFAAGNRGGLSSSQLYDMTELWDCLAALMSMYHGKTIEARKYGIFDATELKSGDMAGEKAALDEWMSYILSLGPSVVLELAQYGRHNTEAGFRAAKLNGWTDWALPISGDSRHTFLREPVARLYEERLATETKQVVSQQREKQEASRQRVTSMAAEIKLARKSSSIQHLNEDLRRDSGMPLSHKRQDSAAPSYYGSLTRRRVSAGIEPKIDTYNRLSLNSLGGVAEDTADRAISKIVGMGFTPAQAKEALKLTDMGNGLRVDRALDLLLRQR